MKACSHSFTSGLESIVDFLYRPENLNDQGIVYMNFSPDTGIFEDKATGSHIYLEFAARRGEKVSKVLYSLEGEDGIVHRWVRKFRDEFGATIDESG
jgi:hypothetical protein